MYSKRLLFNQSWSNNRPPLQSGLKNEGNDLANEKAPNLPLNPRKFVKPSAQKPSPVASISKDLYYYMSMYWFI